MSGIFSSPKTPEPPKPIEMPAAPVVDQAIIDRQTADVLRRRRGRAATLLAGAAPEGGAVPEGAVATKTLLGQ